MPHRIVWCVAATVPRPRFGSLRLEPLRLRVMPGSLVLTGDGQLPTSLR